MIGMVTDFSLIAAGGMVTPVQIMKALQEMKLVVSVVEVEDMILGIHLPFLLRPHCYQHQLRLLRNAQTLMLGLILVVEDVSGMVF